jgi:enoyl-CoA hydratase/carnithine racemase
LGAIVIGRWQHFQYEESNGVATVTFDRPERLNALTFDVYADLRDLTAELRSRPTEVRVLVMRGQGRGFCSGGDVDAIIGGLLKMDTRGVYDFARMTGAVTRNLREMPQPVIAAVNGIAAGAGAVLAAACDLRILGQSARFEFLFTRIGISGGDMGICWLLPRIVGFGRATELLLLGDRIEAERALEIGLANQIVADVELDGAVERYVQRLLQRAPWGLAITKEMLNRAASIDYASAIEMEAWTQTLLMSGHDFREFHAAFTDKREPGFKGR